MVGPLPCAHPGGMPATATLERVLNAVETTSRAGLPLEDFLVEAAAALMPAVPSVAACLSTLDPATSLLSGVRKVGDLTGRNDSDLAWAQTEYGREDPTANIALVSTGTVAAGVIDLLGEAERSVRMREFIIPHFGFADEARVVFTDRSGAWGSISMFRGDDDVPFSHDEVEALAAVAPAFTRGIRNGLLAVNGRRALPSGDGPAVLVFDAHDRLVQSSMGAEAHIARLASARAHADPLTMAQILVTGARRVARGEADSIPRVRARTVDGSFLVMQAVLMGGMTDRAGDVVVTIEEARPRDVVDLMMGAFGLTAREREIVTVLLRGADTKEIAQGLHLSPYTVQDHLKSIFEKSGVTSRRELIARVYFDHYAPRIGQEIDPHGWFADPAAQGQKA